MVGDVQMKKKLLLISVFVFMIIFMCSTKINAFQYLGGDSSTREQIPINTIQALDSLENEYGFTLYDGNVLVEMIEPTEDRNAAFTNKAFVKSETKFDSETISSKDDLVNKYVVDKEVKSGDKITFRMVYRKEAVRRR